MNLDDLELEVLRAAHRQMTPSSESAARAHVAVLERIAQGAASCAGPTAAVPGVTGTTVGAAVKAGVAVAVVGLGVAGGLATRLRGTAPAASGSSPTASAASATRAEPAAASESPSPPPSPIAQPRAALRSAKVPRAEREPTPTSPPNLEQRLAQEVRLLRQADQALRAGDPATAHRLLDQLEREVPNGKLGEEREAARLLARCMSQPGPGTRRRARAFLDRHATSVYSGRIREICKLGPDPDEGSD